MTQLEYEAIEILKEGEPLPVDLYISLNNSGISPEFLINQFEKKKEEEEQPEEQIVSNFHNFINQSIL